MFESAEGPFGVDNPVVKEQDFEPCGEAARLKERCEVAVELELAFAERCLEAGEELAAEDASEHLHRQEEGASRAEPAGMIRRQSAGSDDAVNVG